MRLKRVYTCTDEIGRTHFTDADGPGLDCEGVPMVNSRDANEFGRNGLFRLYTRGAYAAPESVDEAAAVLFVATGKVRHG